MQKHSAAELLDLIKRHGIKNPLAYRMLLSIAINEDKDMIEKFWQLVMPTITYNKLFTSPFPKPGSEVDGLIRFASTESGGPLGINPDECHVLIAGQTGSGKTTLLKWIFSQALRQGIKVWLFVKSKEMRCLLDIDKDILVVDFDGSVKINPLVPCGLPEAEYCNVFSDIFIQSQGLYDGTKNYIMERLNFLYERHKEVQSYPSMLDLYYYIRAMKHKPGRTAYFQESALNRLGGMLSGNLGKMFDCSTGFERAIMERSCIFEIDRLTAEQQIFMVNILLANLFYHRIANRNSAWIFAGVDDANLIFDASFERRLDKGLPIIHHLLSTSRKAGINIFCCTQSPHQLGSSIHSNSAIKIMAGFSDGVDLDFMVRSIGDFSDEEKSFCYGLSRGQIVIKNSLRFPKSVLGIVPVFPAGRDVSNDERDKNNERQFSAMPQPKPRHSFEKNPTSSNEAIGNDEKEFLMAVYLNQYRKTVTEIYDIAKFSACKGTKTAEKLEGSGMIKIITLVKGKGVSKFPILLESAYKILNLEEKSFYGKGAGYEHVVWQHLVAEHFKDFKADIELNKFGKFIDVAVQHENKLIAIEVAMTSVHEKENIEKDIGIAKADFVIIGCKDEKVLSEVNSIIQGLDEAMKSKTRALLLSKILNMNLEELAKPNG